MPTSTIRLPIWTVAVIGAMACGAVGFSRAMAQPAAAPVESQAITVTGADVVRMQTAPPRMQQRRRRPVEVVTTSQPVSFADLDLAKPEDVATLRKRITDASRDACRRLANSAPAHRTSSGPEGCVREASREPLALASQLAAAAQGK